METTMTLAALMTAVGSVFTAAIGYLGQVMNTALTSPVVQLFIGAAFVGLVISWGKKLLHV